MRLTLLLIGLLLLAPAAGAPLSRQPAISILIDDIGDRLGPGRQAVELPGPVALAFLPLTPHAAALAQAAHARGKEVLLHLPMQAVEPGPLGPGAVTLDMDKAQFLRTLEADLASVPHLVGVNNHMGSLLTQHPGHMTWLMQALKRRGNLFFVDSRTSAATVAEQMAQESGLPVLRRHVFLDHDRSLAAVEAEFERLLILARRQGHAVAIGHPYPSTLAVLRARLPQLKAAGIELIPLTEMIRRQKERHYVQRAGSPGGRL
jgi:polysaccharide deacetylase 2 family uncharacterized protein YibQ